MRKQDWAQVVTVGALGAALVAVGRGRTRRALVLAGVAAAGDLAARRASRANPSAIPVRLRWVLAVPRPRAPLRRALQLQLGERVLELGPGVGQDAVFIARLVGPTGRVDVVDVQQEMLDATTARAERHGVHNVVPALADASGRLPYEDNTFDAAYLSSVLGELPDQPAALREIRRVLKVGGRLIVAEVVVDPDFVPTGRLSTMAADVGLHVDRRLGPALAYHARLVKR